MDYSMDCSMPVFPVLHYLLDFAQIYVHWVSDVIQPSHPLPSPSPSAFTLSRHQSPFQWVGSTHQVAKMLELQLHTICRWLPKFYLQPCLPPKFQRLISNSQLDIYISMSTSPTSQPCPRKITSSPVPPCLFFCKTLEIALSTTLCPCWKLDIFMLPFFVQTVSFYVLTAYWIYLSLFHCPFFIEGTSSIVLIIVSASKLVSLYAVLTFSICSLHCNLSDCFSNGIFSYPSLA